MRQYRAGSRTGRSRMGLWSLQPLGNTPGRHIVTANGNAQLDGSGSLTLNGSTDYLTIPDSADWDYDTVTKAFTIAAKVTTDTTMTGNFIYSQVLDGNNYSQLQFTSNTNVRWEAYISGALWTEDFTVSVTNGVETEIILTWDGSNFKLYQDGTQVGGDRAYTGTYPDIAAVLAIGRNNFGAGSNYFDGSISQYYIKKGVADTTTTFTVDSDTVLALNFDGGAGSTDIIDSAWQV